MTDREHQEIEHQWAGDVDPQGLCQIELHVSDLEISKKFYEMVFGWRVVPADIYNYLVLEVPDSCPFGISLVPSLQSANLRGGVVLYFQVEHAESVASRAELFGGKKHFGPAKFPAYGHIWQISDPDGNRFGLFQKQSSRNG